MASSELIGRLVDAACAAIEAHTAQLSELDAAIGDGDHGHNMQRGFREIAALRDQLTLLPLGEALHRAGMALVLKVGGASGPLYGSLLMAMGKAAPQPPADTAAIAALWGEGIEALERRGRAATGEKTMLDVLVPAQAALRAAVAAGASNRETLARVRAAADAALAATAPMKATKGRAAFLGDRSIGHLDPGARSSALLIATVCDVLEGEV